MTKHFADRLIEKVKAKGNAICVGLDPRFDKIPASIIKKAFADEKKSFQSAAADALFLFNQGIIDAVAAVVPVVKLQIAFYEMFGAEGVRAFADTLKYAKSKGLLTIADAKRNDIGSTAEAYASAFLGEIEISGDFGEVVSSVFDADSITVNPYLGWDGISPFVKEAGLYGKGVFVLVKTSNPSSGDLQDVELKDGTTLYEHVGYLVDSWGADVVGESGYSFVGAVVGATYLEQAKKLRKLMPKTIFLVPGYGAQGATAENVKVCFNKDGLGAIVNNSREIMFAYEKLGFDAEAYAEAANTTVLTMKKDLERVL